MAAPAPAPAQIRTQVPLSAREEEAISALADAIAKHRAPEHSPVAVSLDLNLTPEAEQRLIEEAKKRCVSLRPIEQPAEELPPTVNLIRGPANYFERTDGGKKEFITIADGKPYVLFSKDQQGQAQAETQAPGPTPASGTA